MKKGRLIILLFINLNCCSGILAQSSLTVHDSIVLQLDEVLYIELNSMDSNINRSYVFSGLGGGEMYYFIKSFSDYNYASQARRDALEKLIPHVVDLALENIKNGEDVLENYILVSDIFQILQFFPPLAPYLYELGLKLRGFEKYLIQDGQIALPETMKKSYKEVIISNDRGYLTLIDRKSQEWLDWWNSLTPEEQIRHNDTSGAGDFLLPTHLANACIQLSFSQHGNLTKEKLQEIRKNCGHDWESRGLESVRCMNQELISLHEQGILKHNTSK